MNQEEVRKVFNVTVKYVDRVLYPDETYECEFFGVSTENPDLFMFGRDVGEDTIPVAFVRINLIWKMKIEEVHVPASPSSLN